MGRHEPSLPNRPEKIRIDTARLNLAIAGIACLTALISTAGCGPAEDDEDNVEVATVAFEVSSQQRTTPAETSAPRDLTKLVAGSKVSLAITVTVRGRGIPTGGGLGLAVHHAASWTAFASPNPARIHAEGPAGVRLECEWKTRPQTNDWLGMEPLRYPYRRPPTPAHPDQHDRLYNHVVLATVRGRGLLPGEKVVFRVGTERNPVELPPFQDRLHEIRVLADEDGDGKYDSVRDAVRFDIVPDRPDHLAVYVPSVIRRGDEFPVKVVAEDRLNNPIDGWESGLLLSLGGRPEAPFSGTLRCPDSFESRRLEVTVRAAEGDLRGTSDPALIVEADFPYRLYWGDLHGHTQYSDGLAESYEEYFRFGRDLAALDVCAASDHGMWGLQSNLDVVRSFNEPGKFVTFPSWEWGGSPDDAGDRNPVYASEEDVRPIRGTSLEEFYSSMRKAHGDSESLRVITGPHHFTYSDGKGGWPFETWNPEFERFVEVYSAHGMGDTLDNPRRLAGASIEKKYMQEGLAKGLRFAVIANSDTHDSHPGRSLFDVYREGGLTGFWATDLRREAVWDALVSRRTTAAVWNRPVIVFTVNGQWMGSDITTPDAPRLRYTVLARQSDFEVQLLRNGRIVREDRPVDGIVDVDWTDTEGPPSAWYLVRLTAPDERWAWSSPVWVTRR